MPQSSKFTSDISRFGEKQDKLTEMLPEPYNTIIMTVALASFEFGAALRKRTFFGRSRRKFRKIAEIATFNYTMFQISKRRVQMGRLCLCS